MAGDFLELVHVVVAPMKPFSSATDPSLTSLLALSSSRSPSSRPPSTAASPPLRASSPPPSPSSPAATSSTPPSPPSTAISLPAPSSSGGKGGLSSLLRGAAIKACRKKMNNFNAYRDMGD